MPFSIETEQFNGPLDLLLTLIQERKLYINELSLAEVTDAYLAYLEQYQEHPMAETAQFVYIASTLLLIKSRSLLPDMQLTEEEEQDIAELEYRLKLFRTYKLLSRKLGRIWNTAPLLPSQYRPVIPTQFAPGNTSLKEIHNATRMLIHGFPVQTFRPEISVAKTITLEEATATLRSRIRNTTRLLFSEIKKGGNKGDIVVHFLALLELVKNGLVEAQQEKTFDDILVATDAVETPQY